MIRRMATFRTAIAVWLLVATQTACVRNSAKPLEADTATVARSSAILVYSIKAEETWHAPRLAVTLDRYDMREQVNAGNCFNYDRTTASIPSASQEVVDFAYVVPQGYYTLSSFSTFDHEIESLAIAAPAGRAVYVGEFVYVRGGSLQLRRDMSTAINRLSAAYPKLAESLSLAETATVRPPRPFLCAP